MQSFQEFISEQNETIDESKADKHALKKRHQRKLIRQFKQFLNDNDGVDQIILHAVLGGPELK